MKRFFILLLICIVAVAAVGCGNKAEESGKKTVKIAYLPITHALPTMMAKELEKDGDKINIELVKFGSWPELIDALNTGKVDGASVLVELAMKSKEQGVGLKAVALGHTDGNAIIASKAIRKPSDLKGKTIAIPHRQSSHYLLINQLLKTANLSVDQVKIVELAPTEMPSSLASGQIDAYCVAEPFGAKAVDMNVGHVLQQAEDLWDHSLCCALVFNEKFLNEEREAAETFVSQYDKAGDYIGGHKNQTYERTKEYLNIDKAVYDLSLSWIAFDELAITESYYQDLTERMKEAGLTTNPPSFGDFIDSSYIK